MKPSDEKIDAFLQAFARNWMKSMDRPRASTTLGYFFAGLFILFWSSSLTTIIGFKINDGWGALVFLGVAFLLTLPTLFFVRVMAMIGMDRPTRSALLFSSVIGPYVYMAADHAWHLYPISHILGFAASILAFLASLGLDRLIARTAQKPDKV
jgi:cation transport ATPase